MLTKNIQEDELESIISLSTAPLENLSVAINNFKDHLDYYEKLPSIAKPFLKRDIPTISNLEEQEWLDMLNKIKENFKNINSMASNMLGKSPTPVPESESIPSVEIIKKNKIPKMNVASILSQRKKDANTPNNDFVDPQQKKIPEKITIYCPECGQKCNGKRGLRAHIFSVHNDIRKEMLKTFDL